MPLSSLHGTKLRFVTMNSISSKYFACKTQEEDRLLSMTLIAVQNKNRTERIFSSILNNQNPCSLDSIESVAFSWFISQLFRY